LGGQIIENFDRTRRKQLNAKQQSQLIVVGKRFSISNFASVVNRSLAHTQISSPNNAGLFVNGDP